MLYKFDGCKFTMLYKFDGCKTVRSQCYTNLMAIRL